MNSDMFKGRINSEKKKLIIDFETSHPKSLAIIGYGSGIIPQDKNDPNDKKELDLIIVVDDLEAWLIENMKLHPEEFTAASLKYFKKATLANLEKGAPIIYFSRAMYQGQYIKRGIISKKQFLASCHNRSSSYVPFRLEKVTELIKCDDKEIYNALVYDHRITLMLALLMLSKEEQNLYDLITCICTMSFLGDFRMKIHCEDPNKIKNIVNKQLQYFCEDYSQVNENYYAMVDEDRFVINYDRIKEDFEILPEKIRVLLEPYNLDGTDIFNVRKELERFFIKESKRENFPQMLKGIQTTGVKKSLVYGLRKLKKGFNKNVNQG